MIVADSNLIAYLVIPGDKTSVAEAVLMRDPDWAAPLLWRSELRNILALYMRQQGMSLSQAQTTMEKAEELLSVHEYAIPSPPILALCQKHHITSYDAEFATLASLLGAKLVTFDKPLRRALPALTVDPNSFV